MALRSPTKRTSLHDAAESGTYRDLARAMSAKLLNQQTTKGETPLHLATAKRRWWVVRDLLHLKANPNLQDTWGDTPVHIASRTCDISILLMLLSANGDVNLRNRKGESAFHVALKNGHTGAVKIFLDRDLVDVNERNALGWTPLHIAAEEGHAGIANLLIKAKADMVALTNVGLTPFQLALRRQNGRLIRLLGYKNCSICLETLELVKFPNKAHWVYHDICQQCVSTYLHIQILHNEKFRVGCPSERCSTLLRWSDITGIGDAQTCSRYDEMRAVRAAQSDPNFRWCTSPTCKSGQIVSNGDASSFFTCYRCKFKSCFSCRTPSHPAMTCAHYQAHISQSDPRTKIWLDTNTRTCEGCGRWCQKTEGCDHMMCKCGDEWCWRCGASYQGIRREGNHMHKKGCAHYREYPARR